jgi:pimeloyl-ACP methyl ester carboxylesterase
MNHLRVATMNRPFGLAGLLVCLGACATASDMAAEEGELAASGDARYAGELAPWQACPPDPDHPEAANDRCSTLTVPADYGAPSGTKVTLAVRRRPALDQDHRIGILTFNFGGPGGTTVPRFLGVDDQVKQRFDQIGFDPRGIGQSAPKLECFDDELTKKVRAAGGNPIDAAGWMARGTVLGELQQRCRQTGSEEVFSRLDTRHVAYDMEALRSALEAEDRRLHGKDGKGMADYRLNYVGYSYGGVLGATYMTLFPQKTRAFVLDAPVTVTLSSSVQVLFEQMQGFELGLTRFFAWCAAPANQCAFGTNRTSIAAMRAAWDALGAKLDHAKAEGKPLKRPLKDGDKTQEQILDSGELALSWISAAYSPGVDRTVFKTTYSVWSDYAKALHAAELSVDGLPGGDGGESLFSDWAFPAWTPFPGENSVFAFAAYRALDFPATEPNGAPYDYASFTRFVDTRLAAVAPRTGKAGAAEDAIYVGWPFKPTRERVAIRAREAPPALVIGGTYDPAAPVEWARQLRVALGNGSHLIEHDTDGHSRSDRIACLRGAVRAYLVDRTFTTDRCTGDSSAVPWDGADAPRFQSAASY